MRFEMKWFGNNKMTHLPDCENLYADDRKKALARYVVKNGLAKNLDGSGIMASSPAHVHLVVTDWDYLMLQIVRQVFLSCHFPNFRDDSEENRTKATILAPGVSDKEGFEKVRMALVNREMFGNLLGHCIWTMNLPDGSRVLSSPLKKSFVDVEIEVVGLGEMSVDEYLARHFKPGDYALVTVISRKGELSSGTFGKLEGRFNQIYELDESAMDIPADKLMIDVRWARLVNMVYYASTYTTRIDPEDMDDVESYVLPLKTFIYHTPVREVNARWLDLNDTAIKLSNVFCADGFEYRMRSIGKDIGSSKAEMIGAVKRNLADLSRTEHARWNVEKLILGFCPPSPEEMYRDELSFGKASGDYRRNLKKGHVHIDLCSYGTLRRIDPVSAKYDCFLMLAMPEIIWHDKR